MSHGNPAHPLPIAPPLQIEPGQDGSVTLSRRSSVRLARSLSYLSDCVRWSDDATVIDLAIANDAGWLAEGLAAASETR